MHLRHTCDLLAAAIQQRNGSLTITNPHAEENVREMMNVGLVEAVLSDGKKGSVTAIKRVTAAGKTFLRVFSGKMLPGD